MANETFLFNQSKQWNFSVGFMNRVWMRTVAEPVALCDNHLSGQQPNCYSFRCAFCWFLSQMPNLLWMKLYIFTILLHSTSLITAIRAHITRMTSIVDGVCRTSCVLRFESREIIIVADLACNQLTNRSLLIRCGPACHLQHNTARWTGYTNLSHFCQWQRETGPFFIQSSPLEHNNSVWLLNENVVKRPTQSPAVSHIYTPGHHIHTSLKNN